MSFDAALRACELLLGVSCAQQSAEHLAGSAAERRLFLPRLVFSLLLVLGFAPGWSELGLLLQSARALRRFRGPYNGGSDRITLLALFCTAGARFAPSPRSAELAFGYLALQVALSYALSGWAKLWSSDWRSGRALVDVFALSIYPASDSLRGLAARPSLLAWLGYATLSFELAFPLAFADSRALALALGAAAIFHLANAFLLGLNRFFFSWLATYPALIWLQDRVFEGALP